MISACGLPLVASPGGVNAEIVELDVNRFFAEPSKGRFRPLEIRIRNSEQLRQLGAPLCVCLEKRYSMQGYGLHVSSHFDTVAARDGDEYPTIMEQETQCAVWQVF